MVMGGEFLRLVVGNMFSGKSEHLVREMETLRTYGRKRVCGFKPDVDTRDSGICGRNGKESPALTIPVATPSKIFEMLLAAESTMGARYDVLVFDEVQFYPMNSGMYGIMLELLDMGYNLMAAGLPLDFRREPFGITLALTSLAEANTLWLQSYCAVCGDTAPYPQRLIDGVPASYDSPQIAIDANDNYEPRCGRCHVVPGRPRYR